MKHRRHFYFLSALVLTVLSGLLLDGPLYVLTVFLLQMILACTITVIRHRDIDQWFYDHVETTYFLTSIFVGICLLYISLVPFMVQSFLSNLQLLLLFVLPGAVLATGTTWYAARHMHHKKLVKKDAVGIAQVSILFMLIIFALNMVSISYMLPEPYLDLDFDNTALLLNEQSIFMQDVAQVFNEQRKVLEAQEVPEAAYDPLCVFKDCLTARIEGYKLFNKMIDLHNFVQFAVFEVHQINMHVNETNLTTVYNAVVSNYVPGTRLPSRSVWEETFSQYDEANSFVLRGYMNLIEDSEYGNYLFKYKSFDSLYDYKRMLELNVSESQLSQTYRYAYLSDYIY